MKSYNKTNANRCYIRYYIVIYYMNCCIVYIAIKCYVRLLIDKINFS